MANSDGVTLTLRSFAQLSEQYQRAVMLKSQGVKHKEIAEKLKSEFGITCSHNTVNQWFATGGMLEQAYFEYNERVADQTLERARELLQSATLPAVAELVQLMSNPNPMIRLRASQAILGKYIPDKQHLYFDSPFDNEIPAAILEAGDAILDSAQA